MGMRLEIDIPEHHYNNIMAIDSMSLGRTPYKGIIMFAINAIKRGKVLEQEPTTKNDLGVDREDVVERLNALKQLIGYDKDSEIVKATQKSLDMAIKALEQETVSKESYDHEYFLRKEFEIKIARLEHDKNAVLDKIRAEIEELDYITFDGITKRRCLEIIEKYKAENNL